jgi:hypothetical protein
MDWNEKFRGLNIKNIRPDMQIPLRDVKHEKKEFEKLWGMTTELFGHSLKLLKKGKTEKAIIHLFIQLKSFEKIIDNLEKSEHNTLNYLRRHSHLFEPLFNNNYGAGYFQNKVLRNYEIRFRILEILRNEYELIKYFLSETI